MDQLINDMNSGVFLDNLLVNNGLDLPTLATRYAEETKAELDNLLQEDAQYVAISMEAQGDNNSIVIAIAFPGHAELVDKWKDKIGQLLKNVSI